VLASDFAPATATALFLRAVAGGGQALGGASGLMVGAPADIVTLDTAALGPAAAKPDAALNIAVFAARGQAIDTVWARGRKLVVDGKHIAADATRMRFDATVAKLL